MFVLPEDLSALTEADLADLAARARAAFEEASESGDEDERAVAEMERLVPLIQAIDAEIASRRPAQQERAQRRTAALEAVAMSEQGSEPDPEPSTPAPPAEPEPSPEPGTEREAEPVSVAAGGTVARRSGAAAVAARVPRPPAPRNRGALVLTAAADVPGFVAGGALSDIAAVAEAFSARANSFPRTRTDATLRAGVAVINRGDFGGLSQRDYRDDYDLVHDAAKEARLPGGTLLAAGGWCAPSETIYDLCEGETLDGLIDLPEINVTRGGIRFTTGPDFATIYAAAGFCQTEAQAIAGTAKPCVDIECPAFEEVRLDACGVCVRAPILTNSAFPELVQRWIRGTLVAHQHKVSARLIASMVAQAGAVVPVTSTWSVGSALAYLEWAAEGLRYKYRLALNATLEAVAPHWLRAAIRADLGLRTGRVSDAVTDAEIDAHFAARNLRVQWVYDWQPLVGDCVTDLPDTVEVLIYPAGTFVKGTNDIINLDAVYDSTNLATNTFIATFVEEGILLAQTCFSACRIQIPVCVAGLTGAASIVCPTP